MEMEKLFDLMRSQLELQDRRHQEQMCALTALLEKSSAGGTATTGVNSTVAPNFSAFDSTTDL